MIYCKKKIRCFGTRRTLQYDGKKCLPTIQEDVINKSTESVSTFQSDCTVENSREEYVLFEDVRARSAKASHAAEVAISPSKYSLTVYLV